MACDQRKCEKIKEIFGTHHQFVIIGIALDWSLWHALLKNSQNQKLYVFWGYNAMLLREKHFEKTFGVFCMTYLFRCIQGSFALTSPLPALPLHPWPLILSWPLSSSPCFSSHPSSMDHCLLRQSKYGYICPCPNKKNPNSCATAVTGKSICDEYLLGKPQEWKQQSREQIWLLIAVFSPFQPAV